MTRLLLLLCLLSFGTHAVEAQQPASDGRALTVVNGGPNGEVASLAEANEIRIVFSEPMVAIGRIPAVVRAPFVRITPAIPGAFRWSGTTILIFTPDAKQPLPFATRFTVTVDASATAISGRKLASPYSFAFTTPTVKLLSTDAYRRGRRADAPYVILLRFNQPVEPADVAKHLTAKFEPHEWVPPAFTDEERKLLTSIDPASLARFATKVSATSAAASATSPVGLRLTTDWDKDRYPAVPTLVALETTSPVPPESWIKLTLGGAMRSPAGPATPQRLQQYTLKAEPAFFVVGASCSDGCDPDHRNAIRVRADVRTADFVKALKIRDVTSGVSKPVAASSRTTGRGEHSGDYAEWLTIEDAGYAAQPPATNYAVSLASTLTALDGQVLGYTWLGVIHNQHRTAFTSFGDGHGVWESSGGTVLPFYARNLFNVKQWTAPLAPGDLMPTIRDLTPAFSAAPSVAPVTRKLGLTRDRIQSHGLDVSKALNAQGTGLVWAAVENGDSIPNAKRAAQNLRASVVQVTNLGVTVKDSPQNTLVFVTRLDNAAPIANARVAIINRDNSTHWTGTTGADGVAIGPGIPYRERRYTGPDDYVEWQRPNFLVIAEKDGDIAYVAENWNEGIEPWDFGVRFNRNEAEPMLRGTVFSDRGVYRLAEEVQFKAILRHNTATGIRLLKPGTPVSITLRDSQYRLIDERTVTVNDWSSAEWKTTIPSEASLGTYSVRAVLESEKPKPKAPENVDPGDIPSPMLDDEAPGEKAVHGSFLVAAYRRPDFRVDVTLKGERALAGEPLQGVIAAKYLFGSAMGARPVKWAFTRAEMNSAPAAVNEKFPEERWQFVGWGDRYGHTLPIDVSRDEDTLAKNGEFDLTLTPQLDAGAPFLYTLEGDVEDLSRQHLANRASLLVHPAPWYIGLRRPSSYFIDQKQGLKTEVVAVSPDGQVVPGVTVAVRLNQVQWNSVRRSEGNGFYTWETNRQVITAGTWTVTSAAEPVPLDIALPNGGYFIVEATARDTAGRYTTTNMPFYALGDGYTAWARFDHNRIEIVPDRRTYKPGDSAKIMIQSPWEHATALVTTEREGIRSHRQFTLTSTQQSITLPIAEQDIPNMFVSVLLVKGRSVAEVAKNAEATASRDYGRGPNVTDDPSDPGKPAFRLGYVELKVEDASKRLAVSVRADKEEYRPANTARVVLDVKDAGGRGTASEVTLWAVDYGVLSLTAYRTPDVLGSVYVHKALQVMNADNRQRIISRRVLTPKGETEGGGGGADEGAGTLRKDFRVLAFWLGSVVTDANGKGSVEVKLPESLTTYRIMAVAADRGSRFGSNDTEVRINKPLTLKAAFPRFLALGDKAHFGAVVTSQLKTAGTATVTIKSLDPDVLEFTAGATQTVQIGAGGSSEVRFDAAGKRIGRARVQMTAKMANETDAFEDLIPVELLVSPETVAAHGEVTDANPIATEALRIPTGTVPGVGGLTLDLSSTAMVGLGEGARYLVEYPFGCAEQRSSRTLALVLASDLGDAFSLPGMDTAKMRPAAQQNLKDLERFQCANGGFAYWPGDCAFASPYLTAYILHVFKTAVDQKYQVDTGVRERAYSYLERHLAGPTPTNEGWWPSYTAWQAFAVKVLVEGGRNQDSNLTRLYGYRDRMPVFGLAYLHDAMVARGGSTPESSARIADLRRRLSNAILPEAGSAHVEELDDPYLAWYWSSNVRTTAIVLNSLVKGNVSDAPIRQLVRWMMAARKDGRWGNTQENALAMEALVAYYKRFESAPPDFRAIVKLGTEELAKQEFKGRSTKSTAREVPMAKVLAQGPGGTERPLTFSREGTGTLFYTARLRYAADQLYQAGLDNGMRIERSYAPFVENGTAPAATSFKAGDLVRVTLTFYLTKERRYVAVTDPLPAGFEAVESWFATTAASLAREQDEQIGPDGDNWMSWWRRGGFDRIERFDDRVQLFATRLSEGRHEFTYIARATTAGTFRTAPARAEEMYTPEVFGRTQTAVIEVKR